MPETNVVEAGELQKDYVLSQNEIDSLKQSLGAHTQVLGATDAGYMNGADGASPVLPPDLRVNRRKLGEQAKQIKTVLDRHSPQPIPEKEKDRYFKRAKQLEDIFKPFLETREELHAKKRDSASWQSAMDKAVARTYPEHLGGKPHIERAIAEWKYIMRRLEPNNPSADNLNKLRKDR